MQYVWVILLFLPSALSQSDGRFRLVVPEAPVSSVPGSDVVLSCSVREYDNQNIRKNAEDLTVTWSRSDLKDLLVHLYEKHKDPNTDQIPFYSLRTAVFKEELKNGNVSLKLSNVQPSDEGEYRCRVDSTTWRSDKTIKLSVEAMGSEPVITMEKYESGKFSLLCESKGWRPKPELQWRNSKGVKLTAETETQEVADLFNMKSRISVEEIDSYYCTVTQRDHEKEGLIDSQTLHEFVSSEARKAAGIAVGITIGVLLLVAGVIFYFYNEKRKREAEINEVTSLMNSDGDGRLLHHNLSQHQWDYVEETLLKSEEDLKEFNLRKFDPSDRGVEKLKKVIASSKKAVLKQCDLTEKSCEFLASVLSSENSLTDLDLSINKLQDSGVKKLCEGLKNSHCKLQNLRLEDCDVTKKSCAYLAEVLKSQKSKLMELILNQNRELTDLGVKNLYVGLKDEKCKLQILRLENCDLTEESCADLASVLESEKSNLIELNLNHNRGLRHLGVYYLCVGLPDKNCKLQILRLEDCDLTEESCKFLASVLKSEKSKLIELNLSQNRRLGDLGVNYLCDELKSKNCKLQILRLEDCDLTEKSCADLAVVLQSENSKLIELNLNQNRELKDSGVEKLCSGLQHKNCKLKILRLEFCGLTGKSCEFLAEVLKSENSKLIELTLSKNKIQNSGVEKLCDGLKDKNCKLKILRLAECRIMVKSFTALASALIKNPSSPLEELDLSRNEIEVSEQELLPELNDTLPNLKVKLDECSIVYIINAARASENHSSPLEELDLSGNDQKESELELLTDDTCV